MKTHSSLKHWTAAAMLVTIAVATVAPVAEAGRGPGRGPKVRAWDGPVVQRAVYPVQRTVLVERHHSDVAPVLAGLIGGFVLGTAISNAAPVQVDYSYYDPYCDVSFVSLDRYRAHLHYAHHPRLVRVIDPRDGACVHVYTWRDGGWCCDDPCVRDRGYDRGCDRDYDRGYDRDDDWDD